MAVERYLRFMEAFRSNILRAADELTRLCYDFRGPPVQEPSAARDCETIALLEEAGWVLPASLRAFYQIMGSVNFEGDAPADWSGCQYPDPLSIVPLDTQFWRGEISGWQESDRELFRPQFSGDKIHKAGFSGGAYYFGFDHNEDATIFGADLPRSLTSYLTLCNDWGGFPGLRACVDHSWPLAEITRKFVALP